MSSRRSPLRVTLVLVATLIAALLATSMAPRDAVAGPSGGPATAEGPSKAARLTEAKAVYDGRATLGQHRKAMALFAKLAEDFPDDKELQVWCARTANYLAHREQDSTRKHKVATRGLACATRIRRQAKSDYDGKLWWILTKFRVKQAEGVMDQLTALPKIKDFVVGMVRAEPTRPEGYFILGTFLREVPGPPLSFGDPDKAVRLLEKADELSPDHAETLLELAQAYAKVDDEDKARATYERCIAKGKGHPELSWETADARAYAKKMLKELD